MPRPKYAYYLEIEYPEGSHDENGCPVRWWLPEGIDPEKAQRYTSEYGWFIWPISRTYLTPEGAHNKARKFEQYGAKVTVRRSEPIVWGAPETPRPRRLRPAKDTIKVLRKILDATREAPEGPLVSAGLQVPEVVTAGTNQQADDDQYCAKQNLTIDQLDDSVDHQDHCQNPK